MAEEPADLIDGDARTAQVDREGMPQHVQPGTLAGGGDFCLARAGEVSAGWADYTAPIES